MFLQQLSKLLCPFAWETCLCVEIKAISLTIHRNEIYWSSYMTIVIIGTLNDATYNGYGLRLKDLILNCFEFTYSQEHIFYLSDLDYDLISVFFSCKSKSVVPKLIKQRPMLELFCTELKRLIWWNLWNTEKNSAKWRTDFTQGLHAIIKPNINSYVHQCK